MDKKSDDLKRSKTGDTPKRPTAETSKPMLASDPTARGQDNDPRATIDAVAAVVVPPAGRTRGDHIDAKAELNTNSFKQKSTVQTMREMLPGLWSNNTRAVEDEEEQTHFDGTTPVPELTSRDIWKAIRPPVQSTEEKRDPELYAQAINQFAVGHNARYEPEAPDKSRAHIFIWDVTRAMNAEVPHFVGSRELTLVQTIDWVRYEGHQRGWVKVAWDRAQEMTSAGLPVLVTPRNMKIREFAVLRPGVGSDGLPRVASASTSIRGNSLTIAEAIGSTDVEYFMHP